MRAALIGLGFLAGMTVLGCGRGDAPTRVVVYGTVDWQGSPLAAGSVSFLPEQGAKTPPAIADIVRGEYRFTASNGPLAGAYRVVVMLAPGAKKGMLDAAPRKSPASAHDVPGRWEFRVTVPSQSSFQYDVRLP